MIFDTLNDTLNDTLTKYLPLLNLFEHTLAISRSNVF